MAARKGTAYESAKRRAALGGTTSKGDYLGPERYPTRHPRSGTTGEVEVNKGNFFSTVKAVKPSKPGNIREGVREARRAPAGTGQDKAQQKAALENQGAIPVDKKRKK